MSGVSWEEDSQPDLVEWLMRLWRTGTCLVPEVLGLQQTGPLVLLLALYTGVVIFGAMASIKQAVSRLTTLFTGFLWVVSFLLFPTFPHALYPRAGLLSLALKFGDLSLRQLHKEQQAYHHPLQLDRHTEGLLALIEMEIFGLAIVSAFGYPTFSASDTASSYLCLAPLVAIQLIFLSYFYKGEVVVPAGALTNGTAVSALPDGGDFKTEKEKNKEEPVDSVDNKADDVTKEDSLDLDGEFESVEEVISGEKEEIIENGTSSSVEELGKESVEIESSESPVIKDTVEEHPPVVEELVEEIINESLKKTKEDNLFQKLQTSISDTILSLTTCTTLLVTWLLTAFPWTCLLLTICTTTSHLAWAYSWYHLTSSSISLLLPLLTLAPLREDLQGLGLASLTFLIINQGV